LILRQRRGYRRARNDAPTGHFSLRSAWIRRLFRRGTDLAIDPNRIVETPVSRFRGIARSVIRDYLVIRVYRKPTDCPIGVSTCRFHRVIVESTSGKRIDYRSDDILSIRSVLSLGMCGSPTRHSAWHVSCVKQSYALSRCVVDRVRGRLPVQWRTTRFLRFRADSPAAIRQGPAVVSFSLSLFVCPRQKHGRSVRTVASFTLVTHQRQLRAGNFNCASIQPALVPRTSLHSA